MGKCLKLLTKIAPISEIIEERERNKGRERETRDKKWERERVKLLVTRKKKLHCSFFYSWLVSNHHLLSFSASFLFLNVSRVKKRTRIRRTRNREGERVKGSEWVCGCNYTCIICERMKLMMVFERTLFFLSISLPLSLSLFLSSSLFFFHTSFLRYETLSQVLICWTHSPLSSLFYLPRNIWRRETEREKRGKRRREKTTEWNKRGNGDDDDLGRRIRLMITFQYILPQSNIHCLEYEHTSSNQHSFLVPPSLSFFFLFPSWRLFL